MSADTEDDEGPEQRQLEWGQTPFDELSRDELLRQCQRLFAATESLTSIAHIMRHSQHDHPFWTVGLGARAVEQGDQALAAARQDFDRESIYRSFFRYARDLLFTSPPGVQIGSGWDICPKCEVMIGASLDGTGHAGQTCYDVTRGGNKCDGVFRPIQWSDLQPKQPASAPSP